MMAHIPILTVSLAGKVSDGWLNLSTKCIFMHFKSLNYSKIRISMILYILSDHVAPNMRMCASGVHGLGSACKASFYNWCSCFGMNWPPGSVPDVTSKVFPDGQGVHSVVLCSTSDPPDSNLSTLNKYKLRNRSLLPKSRERSIRQGGRMGDKYRRYKTCH
jgi:hypothetical protein